VQTRLALARPRRLQERILLRRWIGRVLRVALPARAAWAIGRQAVQVPALFMEQVNGLQLGLVCAFIALAYTPVYGIVRLVNLARAELRDLLSVATGVGKAFVAASSSSASPQRRPRRAHRRGLPSVVRARQ